MSQILPIFGVICVIILAVYAFVAHLLLLLLFDLFDEQTETRHETWVRAMNGWKKSLDELDEANREIVRLKELIT